ncbi:hypothetical protein [Clostridium kluyveri]|uniref:hypothetical protein n=1 Tax=Clostridium kluyveri TaxID=1534 RepID=UPI002246B5F8|nr:hypothetical protein [Clostridium kluyveri]UZQ51611.1 hypothetical protein OP486_05370 [Clostridium kluyveri]
MDNYFKFKILKIDKKPDVTAITAECMGDSEIVTLNIATILADDRSIVKAELLRKHIAQTTCGLHEGEII